MDHFLGHCLAEVSANATDRPATDPSNPAFLGFGSVALASALIVVNALVSVVLHLDLHGQLLIAAIRCVLQLLALGYILGPIFAYNTWWLVLGYSFIMLLVGNYEACARPAYSYTGMFLQTLMCLGSSAGVFLVYSMLIIIQIHPWYQPQYFIPVLGMLLGNAISGISVGLTTVLEELSTGGRPGKAPLPHLIQWPIYSRSRMTCFLRQRSDVPSAQDPTCDDQTLEGDCEAQLSQKGRERVELLLSLGASRMEATSDIIQRAARVALTPILNQMSVVGLVSIPGMMTGQILSGSDPSQAARYQMIVMFAIAATTATSSVSAIGLATFWIVDTKHRVRGDRLLKKKKGKGPLSWLSDHAAQVMQSAWQKFTNLFRKRHVQRQSGSADFELLLNQP